MFGMPISPAALKFAAATEKEEQQHGGPLHWPGTADGFPVRGQPRTLTAAEYEAIPHVMDFKSRLFYLWIPEDKAAFDTVMEREAHGWYHVRRRVDRWSDDPAGMVVWLEWLQIYGQLPPEKPT